MKPITFTLLSMLTFNVCQTNAQETIWAKNFGEAELYASAIDANGNTFLGGNFAETIEIQGISLTNGSGNSEGWIGKFNSSGDAQWLELVYASNYLVLIDQKIDNDGNLIVCGYYLGKAWFGPFIFGTEADNLAHGFVAKYDTNGECIAAATLDETQSTGIYSLFVDAENQIFVAGITDGYFEFGVSVVEGYGLTDAIYGKFDEDLNPLWMKSIGSFDEDFASEITVDNLGNIFVAGNHTNIFEFDGFLFNNYGSTDNFVFKTNSNGFLQWVQNMGSASSDTQYFTDLITDTENNVYFAATMGLTFDYSGGSISSYGTTDAVVMKLSANTGNPIWVIHGGGSSYDYMNKMVKGNNNNMYLCGYFYGAAEFQGLQLYAETEADGYYVEISEGGTANLVAQTDGNDIETIQTLCVDAYNNLIIGGYFTNEINFVDGPTLSLVSENADIFLAKITTTYSIPEVGIISANNQVNMSISPNPAHSVVYLQFNDQLNVERVNVYNMNGELVLTKAINAINDGALDVTTLTPGVYMIYAAMLDENSYTVKQLIIN